MTAVAHRSREAYRGKFFNDEDFSRLLRDYPHLKGGDPEKYCPTCHKENDCTYRWGGQVHQCDCFQQLHLHMHYLNAGIGKTYQRLDWEDYHGNVSIDQLAGTYVDSHVDFFHAGVGLWLYGDFGTGKTMVANLMLKEFVRRGYTCFATTFSDTIEMYTAGWKSVEDKRLFERRFKHSEVLLLDDLGKDLLGTTILSESTFDSILRTRVQQGLVTFITTNLEEKRIQRSYGAAALSLLREKSMYTEFAGIDYRPTANARHIAEITAGERRPIT